MTTTTPLELPPHPKKDQTRTNPEKFEPALASGRVLLVYRQFTSSFIYYPWMLWRAGFQVDVVCTKRHEIRSSRCIARVFTPPQTDADFASTVADRLLSKEYCFLLLVDEPSRRAIYDHADQPGLAEYLPISRCNALFEAFQDKEKFHLWCERHHIPVPRTHAVRTESEALSVSADLGFPVVLKGSQGMGGCAVKICHDINEVRAAFADLSGNGSVLAQEYIAGPVGSTSFVALRGKLAAWIASEKYIALKGGLGPSAVRRIRTDPELGRIARLISESGEVSGITGFDWMETAPGKYLVIDPHMGRCTPPAAVAHLVGVDFGRAVRELIEGDVQLQEPVVSRQIIVLFPQAIELVIQGHIGELLWKAFPLRRDVSYFFGPWRERRLSIRVGWSYFTGGMQVLIGAFRNRCRDALHAATTRRT